MIFQARTGCSGSAGGTERGNIFWSLFDKSSIIGGEIRVTESDLVSTGSETIQFSNTGIDNYCFEQVFELEFLGSKQVYSTRF